MSPDTSTKKLSVRVNELEQQFTTEKLQSRRKQKDTLASNKMVRCKVTLSMAATCCCLILLGLMVDLSAAGGKGNKGSEGNIIISTGGGQTTKVKIMKVPVPYPVIKHVPYPVPVPIIQKKYIPVEKYIPVYKHHEHGSGGHESQQNEQYGPAAGQEVASSSNTAHNYESTSSSIRGHEGKPESSHYNPMHLYGSSSMSNEAGYHHHPSTGNPMGPHYGSHAAATNGYEANNIYSGSSGYTVGYGSGGSEYGNMFGAASSSGLYGAGNPYGGYETGYGGYQMSNPYGGEMAAFQQQMAAAAASQQVMPPSSSHYQYGHQSEPAGRDADSGASSPHSISSSSSSGSLSSPVRHVSGDSNSAYYSTYLPHTQTSVVSSPQASSSSSSASSSARQNRVHGSTNPSASSSSHSSKSGRHSLHSAASSPSLSTNRSSGYKSSMSNSGNSVKTSSSSSSPSSSSSAVEMMAVSSTPTAYHQTLPFTSPTQRQTDQSAESTTVGTNRQQNSQQLMTPTTLVSLVPAAQQSTVTNPANPQHQQQQQQHQPQQLHTGSLLSANPVGNQIIQSLRKFTNQLTNSTQTTQPTGSSTGAKLLG